MSDEQTQDTPNNPENDVIPVTSTAEYVPEESAEQPQTPSEKNDRYQVYKEPLNNVVVNIPKQNNKTTNGIAIVSAAISAILLLFTYLLFLQNMDALRISRDAVSQSAEANRLTREMMERDRINDIQANEKDNIKIRLDSQGLQSQIKSLNDANDRFEKQNDSYLQMKNVFIVYKKQSPNEIDFNYFVYNVGKQPAHMVRRKHKYVLGFTNSEANDIKWAEGKKKKFSDESMYINEEGANNKIPIVFPSSINVSKYLKEPNACLYIIGEHRYINLVTGKKKTYKYCIRILDNPPGFHTIYNKNYP